MIEKHRHLAALPDEVKTMITEASTLIAARTLSGGHAENKHEQILDSSTCEFIPLKGQYASIQIALEYTMNVNGEGRNVLQKKQ